MRFQQLGLTSGWYALRLKDFLQTSKTSRQMPEPGDKSVTVRTPNRISLLISADGPVSRILCDVQFAERTASRGDHSSRPRLAPRLQQPTPRFSLHHSFPPYATHH